MFARAYYCRVLLLACKHGRSGSESGSNYTRHSLSRGTHFVNAILVIDVDVGENLKTAPVTEVSTVLDYFPNQTTQSNTGTRYSNSYIFLTSAFCNIYRNFPSSTAL